MRHQIYFPRTTSDRYKDLHNVKSKQTNKVAGIRRDEMDKLTKTGTNLSTISESSPPLVDPMRCCGFINIRLKPPLHSKGIKRMALPADTVVTVSGSILVDGQEELIKSVRTAFENCESDYIVRTLTLPATAPLAKTLTVRSTREKFILEHNLVGLRWEEGGRHNDFVGTAKVWAFNLDDMFRVIQEFRSNAENFVTNDASNQPVADGSDATISISDKAESFKTMDGQANAFHVSANPQQMTPMLQSLSFDGNMAIDSSNFATLDSIDLPVPPGLPAIKPVPQRAFSWTSSQPVSNSVYTTLQPDGVTVNAAPRPKSDTILGLNLNGVHELFSSGDALDGIRELRSEQTSQHLFSRNLFEVEQVEDKIGLRHNPKLQEFNGKGYNPVSGFGTSGRSFSSHQSPVDPRTSYFFAPPYAHSASPAGIPRAQSYDPRQGYGSTSLSSVSRFTSIDTQELQGPSYGDVLASSSSSTDHFGRSSVRQGGFVPHQSHPLDVNTSTWKNSGVARTTTTIAHPSRRSEAISYDMNTGCTMKSNSSLATSYFAGRKETLASRSSDFASSSLSGRYSSGHTSIDRFDTPSGGFYSDDSIGFRSKQELPNTPHSHLHGVSRKGHFPIDSQETTSRPTPAFFPGVLDGRTQKHWPEQYSYDSKLPSAANNYTAQSADQYSSGQHQQCNPSGMFSGGERRHLPSQPQGDFTTSYVYNPYGSGRPQDNNGSRRY